MCGIYKQPPVHGFIVLITIKAASATAEKGDPAVSANRPFMLSADHISATIRKRRIVVNHQADGLLKCVQQGMTIDQIMQYEFGFAD